MFDILTITCGRNLYLNRLLTSISTQDHAYINKHTIVFQNNSFEENIFLNIDEKYKEKIQAFKTDQKKSVGNILNQFKNYESKSSHIIKLDDDALIRSQGFFINAFEIANLVPECIFSPFPVGLINNLGGVQSNNRKVMYSEKLNTFYTFRKVNHVGGFARIAPLNIMKNVVFSDSHNEDTEFSSFCNSRGIEMFYLENSLIVEHQESTLGQHARYGEDYFKGRF